MVLKIQPFYLLRKEDIHGKSGEGIVAIGCVLPSGHCIIEWLTFTSTITIFQTLEHVQQVHGHEGKTEVVLGDPPDNLKIIETKVAPTLVKKGKKKKQ